ncbi:MAG: Decarbamoylnovobiocin carbamoyltransferase [bacterium ADurb.Bin478]|nr:MAG: Decarbamoylnovobiocin carbamoyltransferase [bacterium ADurb.Bin478]
MKRTLNRRKQREEWIPLGVSCLAEQGDAYFDHWQPSPFMTRLFRVRGDRRAEVPAAVHGDGSCRVQAVAGSADLFRKLLECFYGLTGTGMVLNSSLNRHGEPIVHRPADAMHLLLAGVIDELVIGDSVIKSDREAA